MNAIQLSKIESTIQVGKCQDLEYRITNYSHALLSSPTQHPNATIHSIFFLHHTTKNLYCSSKCENYRIQQRRKRVRDNVKKVEKLMWKGKIRSNSLGFSYQFLTNVSRKLTQYFQTRWKRQNGTDFSIPRLSGHEEWRGKSCQELTCNIIFHVGYTTIHSYIG